MRIPGKIETIDTGNANANKAIKDNPSILELFNNLENRKELNFEGMNQEEKFQNLNNLLTGLSAGQKISITTDKGELQLKIENNCYVTETPSIQGKVIFSKISNIDINETFNIENSGGKMIITNFIGGEILCELDIKIAKIINGFN